MTFVRRPDFSPDGEFLIVPTGCMDYTGEDKIVNCTYLFRRKNFRTPLMIIPTPKNKPTLAARFSPVYYKLGNPNKNKLKSPFRSVFAVVGTDQEGSLAVYQSEQASPVALISDIHYQALTDLSWSSDGRVLAVSSLDGYISFIRFDKGELGEPLETDQIPPIPPSTPKKQPKKVTKAKGKAKAAGSKPSSACGRTTPSQ